MLSHCPKCKADMQGAAIPEESRQHHSNATHFIRWIALYSRELDRTTHFRCPDCGPEVKR
jgi:desulfoferrodoxin (superoxide reductase-like protein)